MAKLNVRRVAPKVFTHEGAKAKYVNPELQLRRSVLACLLWEDSFYEEGEAIATRISNLVAANKPEVVAGLAIDAREQFKLRHVPLLLVREMARLATHRHLVADTLERVIQRADELTEFLAIYWKDGKEPLSAQVKKGLARAFTKFNAFQLAKYNRDGVVKLRDVLFLSHAKPLNEEQAETWKKLIDGTLPIPDTWEVALSAGQDKKEAFTRLLKEKKLGALALLRNLRNMTQAGVSDTLIENSITTANTDRVLPYRFIAAAKYAPQFEPSLEQSMFKCAETIEKLPGRTAILIDVSGSMDSSISSKSDLNRIDAAAGLAILLREITEHIQIFTFSERVVQVAARRGFALRDAIQESQNHGGTYLGAAVESLNKQREYDRLIVLTDEQSADRVPDPKGKGYVINVSNEQHGVGYGKWTHIDGWSEAVVDYIKTLEKENKETKNA